jgi:hypothetical protein
MVMTMTQHGKYTGDRSRDSLIASMGQHILNQIKEDGSFKTGSALVWLQLHNALWRLWDYTGEQVYLDTLIKVAKNGHSRRNERGPGQYLEFPYIYGLWALEPLTELYKLRPEEGPWISEMIYMVGDDVMSKQYTLADAQRCAWVGGFKPNNNKGHPNWNHTLKQEAMADAYHFATLAGKADKAAQYKASALAGAAFLLKFQHRKGETDRFKDSRKPIGGLPLGGDDPSVRIDIPGHGSIAMLKTALYMGIETAPGAVAPVLSPMALGTGAAPAAEGAPPATPAAPASPTVPSVDSSGKPTIPSGK